MPHVTIGRVVLASLAADACIVAGGVPVRWRGVAAMGEDGDVGHCCGSVALYVCWCFRGMPHVTMSRAMLIVSWQSSGFPQRA